MAGLANGLDSAGLEPPANGQGGKTGRGGVGGVGTGRGSGLLKVGGGTGLEAAGTGGIIICGAGFGALMVILTSSLEEGGRETAFCSGLLSLISTTGAGLGEGIEAETVGAG